MPMSVQPRRPFSAITKPTGAACNLDCSYCFFLSKEVLWDAKGQRMTQAMLRHWLVNYLDAQPDGPVEVAWQGGEPTMRGLDFFREAVVLAEQLRRPGQVLQHVIQTNGTLLDDEWGEFLAQNRFLVGISIDGPEDLHDRYRVNKAGRGTYRQVVRGWDVLMRHGVDTNILCTVNSCNQSEGLRVYRHFRDDLGAQFIQFIPIVERYAPGEETQAEAGWRDADHSFVLHTQTGESVTTRTVDPAGLGKFLSDIFDEWVRNDVGSVFVHDFDAALAASFGQFSVCVHAPECGTALAVQHQGDVYSCDHYIEPGYKLGNVETSSLRDMISLPQQRDFGRAKHSTLPSQCLGCSVRWACHGGCPKDRFAPDSDGGQRLNYLCPGYVSFFTHITPAVRAMGELLRAGRPAADIMTVSGGVGPSAC